MLLSDVSLILQLLVLAFLVSGVALKRLGRLRQHALVMFGAVVLHLSTVLVVMVPSFGSYLFSGTVDFADVYVPVTLVHVLAGGLAVLLGLWLVGSWGFRVDLQKCFGRRKFMIIALGLWLFAVVVGIVLFLRISLLI
jgi:uncharacterized membrane protein YozB (DUF420 family)